MRHILNPRIDPVTVLETPPMEQRPIVNVQTFLNEHPFSAFQWQVFALCFLIVLLDGFDTVGALVAAVFVAGILMNTAQSSMPALAAPFYPTQGRATGVAWMLGLGRFGGIAGSFLVAEMTRRQFAFDEIFTVVGVAGLVAAIALLIKQAARPDSVSVPIDAREISAH
jgi:MFS family permease